MTRAAAITAALLALSGCELAKTTQPSEPSTACLKLLAEYDSGRGELPVYAVASLEEARCERDCEIVLADENAIGMLHRGGCFCRNAILLQNDELVPLDLQALCDLLAVARRKAP